MIYLTSTTPVHDLLKISTERVIRPHRKYLPSPRPQWRKYDCGKEKVSVSGGTVGADLFYVEAVYMMKNQPDKDIGSYESDEDLVFNEDDDDVFRRASNASQITHFSDELQRK